MQKLTLEGSWSLHVTGSGEVMEGHLPGCNYLDLIKNNKIEDPFWGLNEKEASKASEKDYVYARNFTLSEELMAQDHLELVASGVDTLAEIQINGKTLAKTDNVHRTYRFDLKPLIHSGENEIGITFTNPVPFMQEKENARPLRSAGGSAKGIAHLRKIQCHYGWDWGPVLPPAGISGSIGVEGYACRIEDWRVVQHHQGGKVELEIEIQPSHPANGMKTRCTLTAPEGDQIEAEATVNDGKARLSITVEKPQLWWCNGLGNQPLYTLAIDLLDASDTHLDSVSKTIGLRTLTLDTSPDQWGSQFRFVVNGVPIFAKGADWIPSDTFVTRTTREDLDFYIRSAKEANMNMLRVWGGGYYESDTFYDLCDQYGILVWQDFGFACSAYPFYDSAFVENVRLEVEDNVRRLRHRASLALWCGNNENELLAMLWRKDEQLRDSNMSFYHNTLRGWVEALDGVIPYWPGSPSSGSPEYKANDKDRGDTHLWQIWHGMQPIEAFRKHPTRFCSEFGMESLPSMHTVRTFTDSPNPQLLDEVMLSHQKSTGGNPKMLYYLLAKYREPKNFEDLIYLTQIVQANTVRFATEQWRRGFGRTNGSIYWQYNDCWPVASWAGIDYHKQYKAVQYQAKHFNKTVCISNDYFDDRADLYLLNETPEAFTGLLRWELCDFSGNIISSDSVQVETQALTPKLVLSLRYADILKGHKKNQVALTVILEKEGSIADQKYYLLVPDKKCPLPKPNIDSRCEITQNAHGDTVARIHLSSDAFARYVFVEVEGIHTPMSDNFFDIAGGGKASVEVKVPAAVKAEDLKIRVKSLADVEPRAGKLADKWSRFRIRTSKTSIITSIVFKFI